jgi:hypothetical protein
LSKTSEPFDELSEQDKVCAIDITVALAVLAARIPAAAANKALNDWVLQEFANAYGHPPQTARYALKHIGTSLFATDWVFHVEKIQQQLKTEFRQHNPAGGKDGMPESE